MWRPNRRWISFLCTIGTLLGAFISITLYSISDTVSNVDQINFKVSRDFPQSNSDSDVESARDAAQHWCNGKPNLRRMIPHNDSVVALASFPGSGNAWTRYLLHQATGILTGTCTTAHCNHPLLSTRQGVRDSLILVVKTHKREVDTFDKIIMLVRDPHEAILSEFNRQSSKSKTGHAPSKSFEGPYWKQFVYRMTNEWAKSNIFWYKSFPDPSTRHVTFYAKLVTETEDELRKMVKFLGMDISNETMQCITDKKEGPFHRKRSQTVGRDVFDDNMMAKLNFTKRKVYAILNGG